MAPPSAAPNHLAPTRLDVHATVRVARLLLRLPARILSALLEFRLHSGPVVGPDLVGVSGRDPHLDPGLNLFRPDT